MATLSAAPFPPEGLQKLTSKEVMQRAKALNPLLANESVPSCNGNLHIGIYFDGTGNNIKLDYEGIEPSRRKHSNVVKLFNTYPDRRSEGYFSYYIPGVGTPFREIGDAGKNMLGGACAWDGEKRIIWAFTRLLNTPQLYVLKSALLDDALSARIAENMASITAFGFMRQHDLKMWQRVLAGNLKEKKPRVTLINLSVFGFSRGAAEARAFCNWLFEVCEPINGGWEFAGIRIRVSFLGIFDTVASVGIPNSFSNTIVEGHQSWADNNMQIHPAVEQCVHFVAGHEVRAAFPLDSVRIGGLYPGNAREVMYPGAHSDLGGGYPANAVGIAPEIVSEIARIPGAQMYKDARMAGVPLVDWNNLLKSAQADLTATSKTITDFNAYLKAASIAAGPVEKVHQQHMSLYLSYRYKYRNSIGSLPFYQRASPSDKKFIKITTDTFNKRLRHLTGYSIPPSNERYDIAEAAAQYRKLPEAARSKALMSQQAEHVLTMADTIKPDKLDRTIEDFLGNYVHDSMAGFVEMGGWFTNEYNFNGLGIFKYRKIFLGND